MSDKRRRKSLGIFGHSASHNDGSSTEKFQVIRRKQRPSSISTSSSIPEGRTSPLPGSAISDTYEKPESPKARPRTLQKPARSSVFGSLRSLRSLEDEEKLTQVDSKDSSVDDFEGVGGPINVRDLFGYTVLHFGEVQTTGGVFRKRNQYLVLTETHLIRFRNQAKAVEAFPTIPAPLVGSSTTRSHAPSAGSFQDMHTEITFGIALNQIIAAYKLDDGKPYFTIEVSHLDEVSKRATCMQIQLNEPREADGWLIAIRSAASRLRLKHGFKPDTSTLEHVANILERDRDYDPDHFQMFPVVQRASHRTAGRSSSDDLTKLSSTVCYLTIGINKIHFIPLPRSSGRSSGTSLNELDAPLSFGVMTLTSVTLQAADDIFQLIFRVPLRGPFAMHLASAAVSEIVLRIRCAAEYLRPEWIRQPFAFNVPKEIDDMMDPPTFPEEDYKCFDRTLMAYCAAYEVDPSRIRYTVDYECEDAPCFRLLPTTTPPYRALELLAVMRALRYNESFASLSFHDIKLNALRYLYDPFGADVDGISTRSGVPTRIQPHEELPVLSQEVRAIAAKSKRLRRLDFTNSITKPINSADREGPICGILEALVPLCKKSLTNVDWIILNGITLVDSDLDYLIDAASERACHFRALEIGDSGLSVHDMDLLLSTLVVHENTIEVINISGAQGRFSPELFQRQIGYFPHIRQLNLTRVQKTTGPEPLIPPETLLTWRLETLYLSQTVVNEQTVDSLAAYLHSSKSDTLRELHLDQCGISGRDLAVFLQSMTREGGTARKLHLSASENRLRLGYGLLFKSIGQNYGPERLTARMIEFEREHHFRELVEAMTHNTTLKSLDISKASLPYDATEETCEALKNMFATNTCLEELDISGEHAHLDSARFGIGLNLALTGLKKNQSLKVLKIEHQNLGMQGAHTLAEVLEENKSLTEIHCANNEISLQSFTVLVNALQNNRTLLYMPTLDHDRQMSIEKVKKEIKGIGQMDEETSFAKGGALKRTFTGAMSVGGRSHNRYSLRHANTLPSGASYTDQDVKAALVALNEKWNAEVARMQRYLTRNYHLSRGLPWDEGDDNANSQRPDTADSTRHLLEKVKLDRTPTMEKEVELGYVELDEKLAEKRPPAAFTLPEE
jgi:Ran GTPase-activating protein (RanGAP) involved in mRNA processing and transport